MRRVASLSAMIIVATLSGVAGSASAQEAPDALLKRASQGFLHAAGYDQAHTRIDPRRAVEVTDGSIAPYVDFTLSTSILAGRAWRDATADQRKQLTNQFGALLIASLAQAIARQPVKEIDVAAVSVNSGDEDVQVPTRLIRPDGDPIPMIYRMRKGTAGWKIFDVSISGSWVVASYRSLFDTELKKGGVDGLIRALTTLNRQRGDASAR